MGYWISHYIRATGNKEDIDAYVSKLTQRRPKKLNDEGDVVWSEEEFSFYNITPPPEEMIQSGEWWGEAGNHWRNVNWQCYDAPAEEMDTFNVGGGSVSAIRISTKYDWPVSVFHELINQHPKLDFDIWSEGEECEAVEIKGSNGSWTQTEYETPNCHADWEARDNLDSCWCSNYDDENDWYEDCPRETLEVYRVIVTHTHYVKATSSETASLAAIAYDNNFDMPSNTEMVKYSIVPNMLAEPVGEEEVK
jgi:hypothetical protein